MNQQLADYIRQSRQLGVTDGQIRKTLLDAGWQENDVDQHLSKDSIPPSTSATPQHSASLPSAWDLLKQSIAFYRSHLSLILGITIIPLLLTIAAVVLDGQPSVGGALILGLLVIATLIVGYLSRLALFVAIVGKDSTVGASYKKGLSFFFSFLVIGAFGTLAMLGGFLLLIIPGIVLGIWLSQSTYVLFAENARGRAALTKSWHYVKGRGGKVFWRWLFFGFVMILAAFALGFLAEGSTPLTQVKEAGETIATTATTTQPDVSNAGKIINALANNLLFTPLSIIYGYLLFTALRSTKIEVLSEDREREITKKVTIFMVLGVLTIVVLFVLFGTLFVQLVAGFQPTSFVPNFSSFSTAGLPLFDYVPLGR